jgi:parvulin-like peptidyl-prolyl isomerase
MPPFRIRAIIVAANVVAAAWACATEPESPSIPGQTRPAAYVPTQPKETSRPPAWPSGKPPGKTGNDAIDKHVLSSIREDPGAPLEPIGEAAAATVSSGVVQAQFEQAFAPPQLPPGATAPPRDLAALQMQSLDTAMVVARVGSEVVLESDLLTPAALDWLAKVSPGLKPEQIRDLKMQIFRQVLKPHVESMLVYVDACRTIPEDKLPDIQKKVAQAFDETQLPRLMKEAGAANTLEYEQLLRARGQSLDQMRKMFFERALSQQWLQSKVEIDEEIPHAEMIAWYENHLSEYDFPAKARFEQFTVRITPEQPRAVAWNKLAAMGNDVFHGAPFATVAKARSEGATAADGGAYDWTAQGSLASKPLDEAVFSLPVGQLSPIIEDGNTLHIVRVIERTPAGRMPFLEAQVGIKATLYEERRQRQMNDYLDRLRERTPVWTIFDDGQAGTLTAGRPGAAVK